MFYNVIGSQIINKRISPRLRNGAILGSRGNLIEQNFRKLSRLPTFWWKWWKGWFNKQVEADLSNKLWGEITKKNGFALNQYAACDREHSKSAVAATLSVAHKQNSCVSNVICELVFSPQPFFVYCSSADLLRLCVAWSSPRGVCLLTLTIWPTYVFVAMLCQVQPVSNLLECVESEIRWFE